MPARIGSVENVWYVIWWVSPVVLSQVMQELGGADSGSKFTPSCVAVIRIEKSGMVRLLSSRRSSHQRDRADDVTETGTGRTSNRRTSGTGPLVVSCGMTECGEYKTNVPVRRLTAHSIRSNVSCSG